MLNFSRIVLVFLGLALWAQDAGMVLGVSVSYNTRRATLPLSDEQRAEAGRLGMEARQQAQAGKYGEALRSYHQGMAVMRRLDLRSMQMTEIRSKSLAAGPCDDNHQQTGIDWRSIRLAAGEALKWAGWHVATGLVGYLLLLRP